MDDKIYIDQTKCLSFGPECNQVCVESCSRKILRLLCTPEPVEEMAFEAAPVVPDELNTKVLEEQA